MKKPKSYIAAIEVIEQICKFKAETINDELQKLDLEDHKRIATSISKHLTSAIVCRKIRENSTVPKKNW